MAIAVNQQWLKSNKITWSLLNESEYAANLLRERENKESVYFILISITTIAHVMYIAH